MCSNNDDGTTLMTKAESEPINFEEICKKCNESKVAVKLKFKDPQCEKCFLAYVRHKFRASLGSTKIVGRGSTILIVFDGGPKSSVLLDMLRFSFYQDTFKKLHLEPHVLYIDDSALFNLTDEQRCKRLQRVQVLLERFAAFKTYGTSIEDSFNCLQSFDEYMKQAVCNDEISEFKSKLNSIGSHTSGEDYVGNIRTNIIRRVASKLNANFAFTSEIESDLAKIFLTNITLGRGGSVCQDIAFCDSRGDVPIIRPIRNLDIVEVAYYLKFNQIDCLDVSETDTDGLFEKSLQNVTKSFIDELQTNFPSTVSTIFRTGDKVSGIAIDKSEIIDEGNCKFCGSGIPVKKSETIQALEYTRFVSESSFDDRMKFVGDDRGKESMLCYGCGNIFKDMPIANES